MSIIKEIKEIRNSEMPTECESEFHWYSAYTGEIEENILGVIRVVARTLRRKTWAKPLRKKVLFASCWKHSKKGF